jgi:type IV pilus assembly protein PilY1
MKTKIPTYFRRSRSLLRRSAISCGGALGALLVAIPVRAQLDIAPPLPNVMLLVDTSGSMEFKTDGSNVACNPGNTMLPNEKSRWINVVEVLTGTFNGYSCEALDRISDTFKQGEYQLVTGTAPYDWRYPIPYHRPLSKGNIGCAAAPGTLPGVSPSNPFLWPVSNAVRYHRYSDSSFDCTAHDQQNDGIIDAFGTRVRFGLMTFDTEVNPSSGYSGANYTSAGADTAGGQQGLWSYVVGSQAMGKPMGCGTPPVAQEVGARNGAAPAWEGRMVNFGNPNDSETTTRQTLTGHIQEVLLATRPFGATPIAGMLRDAEDFFWNDTSDDPGVQPSGSPDPFDDYGPRRDPYLSCLTPRQQVIILLTDGEPNMDLRPFCSDTPAAGVDAGACPFDRPEEITNRLAHPASSARQPIKTYVVGFALEQVDADLNAATPNVSCGTLVSGGVLSSQCAAPGVANNVPLQACCTLHRIALAGDGAAFFASNAGELRSAISDILRRNVPATSRTQPATAPGGAATGGQFRFFSGFEVGQLALWNAKLTRERWECIAPDSSSPKEPTPVPFNADDGDDFVENVNFNGPTNRRFYTVVGRTSAGVAVAGTATVRRGIPSTDPDGAGTLAPEIHSGLASAFASAVPHEALAIPSASYPTNVTPAVTSPAEARTFFLEWLVGVNANTARYHRCRNTANCQLIGDIYHSTPQITGAPSARLRDASYERFAALRRTRPIVLYTSTNDGFLHAFKVASNDPAETSDAARVLDKVNNELWAFAPPAVLPNLHGLYPYNHQHLLDGVATVSDVVAVEASVATDPPTVFERTANDARGGLGTWRTVLVQGFGGGRGGYFALDVTNPVPDASAPANTERGGPRFLWQLTKDSAGNELFGRAGATPAITTLFFDPDGSTNPREIPVAILPGGYGGTPNGSASTPARTFTGVTLDSRFTPRGQVRGYDWGSEVGARSVTIVRLDKGEIIRTFRQTTTEIASATLRTRTTPVEIDSPFTGQPVAFPGQVGAVADRILVGDADGRLWKINVASQNPSQWTMGLFFDLYPAAVQSTSTHDFDDGQPIATPPVLSVDESGDMTVAVATGDQDALGFSTGQVNYVYSLTEDFDLGRFTATHRVNWLKAFSTGERAVGPLVLFNSNVYFATFLGATGTNVCANGTSTIWGMQYIQPFSTTDFRQGGLAALPNASAPPPRIQSIVRNDAVVFGVSLAQQPTCFTTVDDAAGDDLFGYHGQTSIQQVTPAKFELVMHTSPTAPGAGQPVSDDTIELEAPTSFARVVSWASIIE